MGSEKIKCDQPAVTAAHWANGQRLVLCERCYAQYRGVSRALGVPIMAAELDDGETKCTQHVSPATTPAPAESEEQHGA